MDKTILIILFVLAISFFLTNMALKDIILKDFGSKKAKLVWHFIALIPLIGWLVYFAFGFRKGRKKPV